MSGAGKAFILLLLVAIFLGWGIKKLLPNHNIPNIITTNLNYYSSVTFEKINIKINWVYIIVDILILTVLIYVLIKGLKYIASVVPLYKIVLTTTFYIIGIVISMVFGPELKINFLKILVISSISFILWFVLKKIRIFKNLKFLFALVGWLFLGCGNYYFKIDTSSPHHISKFYSKNFFEKKVIIGTIVSDPDDRIKFTNIDILPEKIYQLSKYEIEVDTSFPSLVVDATVKEVVDGDTFAAETFVNLSEKYKVEDNCYIKNETTDRILVRMLGIDAPEISHPDLGIFEQPGGIEAKEYLTKLLPPDTKIKLLVSRNPAFRFDKYNRLLAVVYKNNEKQSINELMMKYPRVKPLIIQQNFIRFKKINLVELKKNKSLLRVKIYPQIGDYYQELAYGTKVEIISSINEPMRKRNPGGFDYYSYLKARNIYATGSPLKLEGDLRVIGSGGYELVKFAILLKKKILQIYKQTMPFPESSFLGGVTLGLRGGLSPKIRNEFQATGVAHVLAVSGLHVGFVAALLVMLCDFCRIKKKVAFFVQVFGLIIFTLITGASPATQRAALMFSMFQALRIFSNYSMRVSGELTIWLAALIILLLDPLKLPDGSFILSFMAVGSLIFLTNPIKRILYSYYVDGYGDIRLIQKLHIILLRGLILFPFFFTLLMLTIFVSFLFSFKFIKLFNQWSWWGKIEQILLEIFPGWFIASIIFYLCGIVIFFILNYIDEDPVQKIYRKKKFLRSLLDFSCAQLAIQIGMMWPLSSVFFQRFPISGVYANFLAIPLIGVIVQYGFISSLVYLLFSFLPDVGSWLSLNIASLNYFLAQWFLALAKEWANYVPYPFVNKLNPLQLFFYYSFITIFLVFGRQIFSKLKIKFLALKELLNPLQIITILTGFVMVILMMSLGVSGIIKKQKKLKVVFFDVGFGNSVLVITPNNKSILIDGGVYSQDRWNPAENILLPSLSTLKIQKIDILILTSPKPDSIGGIPYILEKFPVKKFYSYFDLTQYTNWTLPEFRSLIKAIKTSDENLIPFYKANFALYNSISSVINKTAILNLKKTKLLYEELYKGKKLIIENIYPFDYELLGTEDDVGNNCPIIKITYGNKSFLLPFHISGDGEWMLIDAMGKKIKSDVLCIPKHGSSSSSRMEFIESVKPRFTVLQYGYLPKKNRLPYYIYESEVMETLERYKVYKTNILSTSLYGAIIFECDGRDLKYATALKTPDRLGEVE